MMSGGPFKKIAVLILSQFALVGCKSFTASSQIAAGSSTASVSGNTPTENSANCTFSGQTILSGGSVVAYLADSVAYGSTCTSQTRVCTNGTLTGSYDYSTCNVAAPASCTFGTKTLSNG